MEERMSDHVKQNSDREFFLGVVKYFTNIKLYFDSSLFICIHFHHLGLWVSESGFCRYACIGTCTHEQECAEMSTHTCGNAGMSTHTCGNAGVLGSARENR